MTNNQDKNAILARESRIAMEARYRMQRPRVSDDQAGEILRLFSHGAGSGDIAFEAHVPIETVRAIISYACWLAPEIYVWHTDSRNGTSGANNPPPVNATSYKHYAPAI